MTVDVFLESAYSNFTWVDTLKSTLKCSYFNPAISTYTEASIIRDNCRFHLYVVTPEVLEYRSIKTITEESTMYFDKTVLLILGEGCSKHFSIKQYNSLTALQHLVALNGGYVLYTLEDVIEFLNKSCG